MRMDLSKKMIKSFHSLINVFVVFSLIKQVNIAISASSITFMNHSSIVGISESFHLCAYNRLAANSFLNS